MAGPEFIAYVALAISALQFVSNIVEKIFGGGRSLESAFHTQTLKMHAFELETNKKFESIRNDFLMRSETHESNQRIGNETIVNNLHLLEKSILELRVMMGENYMRRDSYYKASDELKRDLKEKTDEIKEDITTLSTRIENLTKAVHERTA